MGIDTKIRFYRIAIKRYWILSRGQKWPLPVLLGSSENAVLLVLNMFTDYARTLLLSCHVIQLKWTFDSHIRILIPKRFTIMMHYIIFLPFCKLYASLGEIRKNPSHRNPHPQPLCIRWCNLSPFCVWIFSENRSTKFDLSRARQASLIPRQYESSWIYELPKHQVVLTNS